MADNVVWLWENLIDMNVATEEELGLACALCGTSEETLNRVLYIRTGYRSLEQIWDEDEDYCEED